MRNRAKKIAVLLAVFSCVSSMALPSVPYRVQAEEDIDDTDTDMDMDLGEDEDDTESDIPAEDFPVEDIPVEDDPTEDIPTNGNSLIDTGKASNLGFGRLYPFSARTDELYYFTTTANRSFYQIRTLVTAGTAVHIDLYDASGSTLETEFDMKNEGYRRLALKASARYYLKISGADDASGEIVMSELLDDHADTMEEASVLKVGQEYLVTTEGPGDVDYLTFSTGIEDVTYSLVMDSVAGVVGQYEVQNEAGEKVASYSGSTKIEKTVTKKLPELEPEKKYYIKLTSEEDYCRLLLTVKKTVNKYTITYHLNSGTNHKENPKNYTADQTVTLQSPTRKKHLFDGWYVTEDFSEKISSITGSGKKNYDLYAKWTKLQPAQASIKSLTSPGAGKAKLVLDSVPDSAGYQIRIIEKVNGKKTVTYKQTTKTSISYSGWTQGQKYSISVRAYGIDSCGNRVYGAYSKKATVTIQKKVKKTKKKK